MTWTAFGLVGISLFAYGAAIILLFFRTRTRPAGELEAYPPLTIVKPLKGLEDDLEENLETFFRQDYPGPLAIVIGSLEASDPALELARRVAARHPARSVQIVAGGPALGLNPKVANIAHLARAATSDLVLFSDANVRVRPDYCRRVVAEIVQGRGSLLTSLVAGVGEATVGAAMDNLHLTAFISPAMCFALHFAGITCVVGKTMLLYRSELDALGGFDLVKDILAEDFVLGAAYQKAGKRVLLSPTPVFNVNTHSSVDRFMSRHARWLKMRAVLHVPGMLADLGANPVVMCGIAVVLSGGHPVLLGILAGVLVCKPFTDGLAVRRLRGTSMAPGYLALTSLKDLLIGAVWPYACLSRTIEWRGVRLRIGKGSLLQPLVRRAARSHAPEEAAAAPNPAPLGVRGQHL